eukprot:CAMPEP_0119299046 /NCGR_PEP_ID=MMETSP1333-20130426/1167_1 /TAXON_ID=418940 /ORGANISM="Scyphosphaera apsteinii, Strain RCC1455" /LENGTH=118 /DNA_ID=CAMNT_0007300339 /DNA_START=52 /DNA_END=405 /DNA_ORIENTATION=+
MKHFFVLSPNLLGMYGILSVGAVAATQMQQSLAIGPSYSSLSAEDGRALSEDLSEEDEQCLLDICYDEDLPTAPPAPPPSPPALPKPPALPAPPPACITRGLHDLTTGTHTWTLENGS